METTIKFIHPIDKEKFLIYELNKCPENYLKSIKRDEYFEMILYYETDEHYSDREKKYFIYLIPPFRSIHVSLNNKTGYLIAFTREYLEEDDKEYSLDVFNVFNIQGRYSKIELDNVTRDILDRIHFLMSNEYNNSSGTYLVMKSLLKVFLLNLIRLKRSTFLDQDVDQKRVYQFCQLIDGNYFKERKSGFYARKLNISEKRLNQILAKKMNKSVTQLIHNRLILEAKRKLIASEITIKEIAYELNFKDHSYFSRFFKKQTGMTPEEFKKMDSL
jgi:AraC family transcriptional regulator, transcriptional activator of pobA